MQVFPLWYGVRGFHRVIRYAIRWTRMVTEAAKRRVRILAFWEKHGIEATAEAFSVSRRTLHRWTARLRTGNGSLESLNDGPRRPKTVRRRSWPREVTQGIRQLRREHPNLGPNKVAILLARSLAGQGIRCPAARTVARIIADDPDRMRVFPVKVRHNGEIVPRKRAKRTRKPKYFVATHPGHCGALDTVERILWGRRRYVITFVDLFSRFTFAWATTSHASQAAKEFFDRIRMVFPYELEYVLTDNGSEFMKHFDQELRRLHKTHWHTYPRTPKMNAHCERFNRTIQEEFVDFHEPELLDPEAFNRPLMDYLLWYNLERPHWSLNLQSPLQFLSAQRPEECHMWWRDTCTCADAGGGIYFSAYGFRLRPRATHRDSELALRG